MGIIDKVKDAVGLVKEEGEVLKGEKSKDTYFSSKKEFTSEGLALKAFMDAKDKLFDVNGWSKIPAIANSTFSLYDKNGFPKADKTPQLGDFVKIVLPGPLPENWVRVVDIQENESSASFTVQPSYDPTTTGDTGVVEHFFDNGARSTFKVERVGTVIEAAEIGKNEAINNTGPEAGDRKVINTLISEGGWAGFQKYQWKNLTDYLVGNN